MKRRNPNQLELAIAGASSPTPLSRATARNSRHVEAPAPMPWECVVLAVDTAKRSGYCVLECGRHCESGEVDTLDEAIVERIVANAVERAAFLNLPLVLVLEAPFGGSVDVVSALGVARERWLRAWRLAEQSPARVVKVMPSQWRGPVLGAFWVSQPREAVRAQERIVAAAILKRQRKLARASLPVGDDEAPAILIGTWAAHAARVGRAIGKRAAKASLRAWTTPGGRTRRA